MSSLAVEPGPCTDWVTAEDVAAVCGSAGSAGSDAIVYQTAATEASQILFALSGRLFNGGCEQTVRPCKDTCGCWGVGGLAFDSGLGIGFDWSWGYGAGGWYWRNEYGDRCSCGHLAQIVLSGYPVTAITQVKIDGAIVDASTYRLDEHRYLTRMRDPAVPGQAVFWPACQALDLDDTQPGTWSVTYQFGTAPPPIGKDAAAQLACELNRALTGGECSLPVGTTKVTRQGITVERGLLASFLRPGQTGLVLVDAFLATYNPNGASRRPAVFSPDVARFPRPIQ